MTSTLQTSEDLGTPVERKELETAQVVAQPPEVPKGEENIGSLTSYSRPNSRRKFKMVERNCCTLPGGGPTAHTALVVSACRQRSG